jgi:hypothetical protein
VVPVQQSGVCRGFVCVYMLVYVLAHSKLDLGLDGAPEPVVVVLCLKQSAGTLQAGPGPGRRTAASHREWCEYMCCPAALLCLVTLTLRQAELTSFLRKANRVFMLTLLLSCCPQLLADTQIMTG